MRLWKFGLSALLYQQPVWCSFYSDSDTSSSYGSNKSGARTVRSGTGRSDLSHEEAQAQMEEQAQKWKQWMNRLKSFCRTEGLAATRWRLAGYGDLTKVDLKQFTWLGDVYVRNDFFYGKSALGMRKYYDGETAFLEIFSDIFEIWADQIQRHFKGRLTTPVYRQLNAWDAENFQKEMGRDISSSPVRHRYLSAFQALEIGSLPLMHWIPRTLWQSHASHQKTQGYTWMLGNITHIVQDVYARLSIIQTTQMFDQSTEKEGEFRKPHPRYMDMVDVNTRLHTLRKMEAFAIQASHFESDWASNQPRIEVLNTALQNLKAATSRCIAVYEKWLSKYGDRFQPVAGTPGIRLASEQQRAEMKMLQKYLTTFPEMVSKSSSPRPDDLTSKISVTFSVSPFFVVTIHADHQRVRKVQVGEPQGSALTRFGPHSKERFRTFQSVLHEAFQNHRLWELVFVNAKQSTIAQMAGTHGASVVVHVRTKLVCYFERRSARPRVMEILLINMPGILGSTMTPAPGQSAVPHIAPPANDPNWMAVALTHDSFIYPTDLQPTRQSIDLVSMYAQDYASAGGIRIDLPGQFIDMATRDKCDLTPVYLKSREYLSRVHETSRVAPDVCVQTPSWFSMDSKPLALFPICLNMFPVGTRAFVMGDNVPQPIPKETLAPTALDKQPNDMNPFLTKPSFLQQPGGSVLFNRKADASPDSISFWRPSPPAEARKLDQVRLRSAMILNESTEISADFRKAFASVSSSSR
eukprot:Gregarina_sp_Poly_1__10695@NODE_80_length_15637_cov_125_963134_g68_i0_p1_GENE_NODE_80_length_15637_cov_125_963134_g68_i0NODE_80_length_15637_cov_125_963134_g68_i0_p1_ORF_typecomplete_len749_score75_14APG17/PF04108_12/1_5e03APG17/PF04108_12/0_039DUF2487/PF10673_9/7_9e03DUF2487/PF10673_9/0_44_NODE_80_length_15637_cov_125_963134_g68_i0885011096